MNFKHATKWQAEGIFKCFFPAKPSANAAASASVGAEAGASGSAPQSAAKHPGDATSAANLPESKRKRAVHAVPLLPEEEISELAKRFADAIPENELSVSGVIVVNARAVFDSACASRSPRCRVTCSRTRRVRARASTRLRRGACVLFAELRCELTQSS